MHVYKLIRRTYPLIVKNKVRYSQLLLLSSLLENPHIPIVNTMSNVIVIRKYCAVFVIVKVFNLVLCIFHEGHLVEYSIE